MLVRSPAIRASRTRSLACWLIVLATALILSTGTAQARTSASRVAAHLADEPGVCRSLNQVLRERGYFRVLGAFVREYNEGIGQEAGMPRAVAVFPKLVRDCR